MDDRWSVALATATFAGALAAVDGHLVGVPLIVGVAIVMIALGWRQPALLCFGGAALAAALAGRSLDGLHAPVATGPVQGEVTLVGDPLPDGRGGVTVDVRWKGRRYRAAARQAAAAALGNRLAGDRAVVVGSLEGPGPVERMLSHRHLAGRMQVDLVVGWVPGDPISQGINGLRRTLATGAEALAPREASLLMGLTLGDVRDQPADMADTFRTAGLTHLLAVSGQNVAFVLVVAAPVLTRLGFGARWAATLGVLVAFALLTRCEPSVVRATAMAGVAATGSALGRPTSSLRTLGLAITIALLIDPLLVTALSFRLSVAGSAGIIVGARPIEQMLPGPRWLGAPMSVTLAAQLAVAPLLVAAFGAVPVASLPANLLAVPVTGPVMVWGLTGGLAAGALGGAAATVIHLPTGFALSWIDRVAAGTADWPLGELSADHVAVLVIATLGLLHARPPRGRSRCRTGLRWLSAGTVVVVMGAAALGHASTPPGTGHAALGVGAEAWWADGTVVVKVDGRARDQMVLGRLRSQGLHHVDAVVARSNARGLVDLVETLRRRWPALVVLAPVQDQRSRSMSSAIAPPAGTVIDIGGLRVTVVANAEARLEVTVEPQSTRGAAVQETGTPRLSQTGGTPTSFRT